MRIIFHILDPEKEMLSAARAAALYIKDKRKGWWSYEYQCGWFEVIRNKKSITVWSCAEPKDNT